MAKKRTDKQNIKAMFSRLSAAANHAITSESYGNMVDSRGLSLYAQRHTDVLEAMQHEACQDLDTPAMKSAVRKTKARLEKFQEFHNFLVRRTSHSGYEEHLRKAKSQAARTKLRAETDAVELAAVSELGIGDRGIPEH